MRNIKIIKSIGSGKTYDLIDKAVGTMLKSSTNNTVILVQTSQSIPYMIKAITVLYKKYCVVFEYNAQYITAVIKFTSFDKPKSLNIDVCSPEKFLYYCKNHYNVFIDNIENCNILDPYCTFGFSCNKE